MKTTCIIQKAYDIYSFIIIVAIISTVFVTNDSLWIGVTTTIFFWFAASICVVSLIIPFKFSKKSKMHITDVLFIVLAVYICINYIFLNVHTNMHLWLSLLMVPLYAVVRMEAGNEKLRRWLFVALLAVVLAQAILGLLQLYGFVHSQHYLYKITGTFSNPGPFAGFIAVGVPLALGVSFDKTLFRWGRWLGVGALLACMLVLLATMSRAAWIVAVVSCLPVLWKKFSAVSCQLQRLYHPLAGV